MGLRIQRVQAGVECLQQAVHEVKGAVSAIRETVSNLTTTTQGRFDSLAERVTTVRTEFNSRIDAVQGNIQALRASSVSGDDIDGLRQEVAALRQLVTEWRAEAPAAGAQPAPHVAAAPSPAVPSPAVPEPAPAPATVSAEVVPPHHQEAPPTTPPPGEPPSAPPPGEPPAGGAGSPEPPAAGGGDAGERAEYEQLLDLAAGVAYAEIACHRDTWSFLVERAARTEHFRLPGDVEEDGDGTIEAEISGRTLIAALTALWETRQEAVAGTRALARRIYRSIADALRHLEPCAEGERAVTRVVVDNRPPATEAADAPERSDTPERSDDPQEGDDPGAPGSGSPDQPGGGPSDGDRGRPEAGGAPGPEPGDDGPGTDPTS